MIQIENASYSYQTKQPPVLENITLTIKQGEFVAVLGHNGSGKSTLAKLLNGVLVPTNGSVHVMGMDTRDPDKIMDIRRKVGMVFQNPDNQIVAAIVEEDVAFGLENLGVPSDEIRHRVDEALQTVDMYAYRNYAPHLLSGGQKQRIAIAGVIAMHCACIVMDEPTAMLDPAGRADVMRTVQKLNREDGITIVLVTHFMQEAALADRVLVTENGHVIMDGSPEKILTQRESLRKVRLETPQVTELLYALKAAGMPVNTEIIHTDACVDSIYDACREGKRV